MKPTSLRARLLRTRTTPTPAAETTPTRQTRTDMVRGAGWTDDEWRAYVEKHGGSAASAARER